MGKTPGTRLLPLALALLLLPTTGCLSHTRTVQAVRPSAVAMDATAQQLITRLNDQYNAIQSLTTIVEVVASVGGGTTGKVTEYHPFHGYIIIEKPRNLRVILQVPVLLSKGMDMVSDGQNFKMIIPLESRALVGKDQVVKPSPKPLENLRPGIFFDSMLIQAVQPDELVALTESSRILQPEHGKQPALEEPDYDLRMFHTLSGNILVTSRVVHFNRTTLLPYQQDIFDARGRLSTTATYDHWQRFAYTAPGGKPGEIQFPTLITINRPIDQYALKIDVTKVTPNQTMEPDQFALCIPPGFKVRDMDDPDAPPATAPSEPCGTPSQR